MELSMDITGIGTAVAGIGSAVAGYMGQQETNEMQHQMMQEQQAFQERMSNTAYQRASKDMTAAGLNPMMMTNGGMNASAPQGSSPSPLVKSGVDADSMQRAINSALAVNTQAAQVENIKADTLEKNARTVSEFQRPGLIDADVSLRRAQERKTGQEELALKDTRPQRVNASLTAANEIGINSAVRRIADQAGRLGGSASKVMRPVTDFFSSARNVHGMVMNSRRDAREAFD